MLLSLLCPRLWRRTRPKQTPPRKIAILGGGMAGLSAAYQLTRTPELRRQHQVTVYQLGWRLGGKAASGRDPHGRNVEHGLHVWFGCYENTFKMLQEVYAARSPPPGSRLKTWQDAVKPQAYTPVGMQRDDGSWEYVPLTWPTNDGVPGEGGLLPSWGEMLETVLGWMAEFLSRHGQAPPAEVLSSAGLPPGALATAQPAAALHAARAHIKQHGSRLYNQNEAELNHMLDLIRWAHDAHAKTRMADAAPSGQDRLIHEALAVLRAAAQGIVFDLVLKNRPFESLDEEEFRDWLIRHGADPELVRTTTVVRVAYDTMYQYVDGDVAKPSYAAGTGIGVIARLVGTYKGSMMWLMQAGMGEAVVAPLYEHLLEAGVSFKFFRKVISLDPAADASVVQTIRLERQADTLSGDYQPTIQQDGMTCWPAEPRWEQLANGPAMRDAGVNFESHWCQQPPAGEEV